MSPQHSRFALRRRENICFREDLSAEDNLAAEVEVVLVGGYRQNLEWPAARNLIIPLNNLLTH
jgi:hypothetical protein